jgi:tetratricopeptide (TPR) repeat protein
MNSNVRKEKSGFGSRMLICGCLAVVLLAILASLDGEDHHDAQLATATAVNDSSSGETAAAGVRKRRISSRSAPTAAEIVARKVSEFGRNRRGITEAMARRYSVTVPPDVQRFFDAVEAGDWDAIEAAYQALLARRKSDPRPRELDVLWGPIFEAYGAAQIAHDWPAQKLLDYGNAVLGSLRPEMVYVGGTDSGRWIPTLLNETSGGAGHVILTQNALADGTYLDYLSFLHEGRLATLTKQDSERAFQDYLSDARKRLLHDQQFPDEPRQVRPGEDIRETDGRIQVSGQVAVMSINERLLQMLMEKNPGISFALEESFPFHSTYGQAAPLGPIMELRVEDEQSALSPDSARQSIDYWRATADQLLFDPEATSSPETLKSFSKLAVSHANLFANQGYSGEAEQAYRIAYEICPYSPEALGGLTNLLRRDGRATEARQLVDDFVRRNPDQRGAAESIWNNFAMASPPARLQ